MDLSLLPNVYEFISNTYPFSKLSDLEKDAMATKIKISYHTPDDVLVDESLSGIGLFMIKTGVVEDINKSDGSLRARYSEGDTFGFTQVDKEGESDYRVVFIENTLLYEIPKKVLAFLIEKNKAVGEYFNAKEWVRISSSHNYVDDGDGNEEGEVKTVEDVCFTNPALVSKDTSIKDTAKLLGIKQSDLAMVTDIESGKLTGVVTKSDITLKAVALGMDVNEPISSIMTEKVLSIDAKENVYDALNMMVLNNIKNLPVLKDGKILGYVSTVCLLQNSELQAVYLCKEVSKATDIERLKSLSHQKKDIFKTLVNNNVKPHTIQKVMSHIADVFCQAILKIAESRFGRAPIDYAFVCAGSQARSEVQFLSDQDNCIITKAELNEEQKVYFKKLADFVCKSLDECGYPLCDGNFMASNEKWLCSFEKWKQNYSDWIANTTEEAILEASVFLDMRSLYGNGSLVMKLRQHLIETANENRRFLAILTAISTTVAPPLGLFRQFVLTKDGDNDPYLNIKKQAVNLIVEMARIYGIAAKSESTDTYERLHKAVEIGLIKEDDYQELREAYTFLNGVRFNHQLNSMKSGKPLSNNLNPELLTQFERNHLRDAFRIIEKHQKALKFRFGSGF